MFLLFHCLPWIHSSKEFHKPAWIIWYLLPPTAAVPGRLLLLHSKTILGDVNGCWLLHPRSFTELVVEEVHVQALLWRFWRFLVEEVHVQALFWHFRRFLTVQLVWEPLSQFSTFSKPFSESVFHRSPESELPEGILQKAGLQFYPQTSQTMNLRTF